MPIKNYYIGSGVNDDYSTLKKWWYDFVTQGSGDLVSNDTQVNVYLRGGQQHVVETGTSIPYLSTLPSETRTSFFLMYDYGITTDATRYFNITAEPGYEFYGTFDNPNIPYVTPSSEISWTSKGGIVCYVPYTKINNFIIKDINFNLPTVVSGIFCPNMAFGVAIFNDNISVDRMGIQNICSSQSYSAGTRAYGIYNVADSYTRNCVVNDVYCSSVLGYSLSVGIAGRYNSKILNNTVSNISGYLACPTGFILGVGYPTINGQTIVPPDENLNLSNPEMWFDASVGPFYSGSRATNQLATGLNVIVGRWDSLVNNYSGININGNWFANPVGTISNHLSPTNLKLFEQEDDVENNANNFLRTAPMAGGWDNGYTAAISFYLNSTDNQNFYGVGSGSILSNAFHEQIVLSTTHVRGFLNFCHTFNSTTGTLHAQVDLGRGANRQGIDITLSPIFTGTWYVATITADPRNLLLADAPRLYLEVQNVGNVSGNISSLISNWNVYTTISGSQESKRISIGGLHDTIVANITDARMGEILLYNSPLPMSGGTTINRVDLRSYLYNKWIATTGVTASPNIPSGTTMINNYVGYATGYATNFILGMSTGLGPVPSSNAVFDNSITLVYGNLTGVDTVSNITSNSRTAFNPSLLSNSQLINVGNNLSGQYGFYNDVAGESRSSLWDIGADEYVVPTSENNVNFTIVGYDSVNNNANLAISGDVVSANSMTLYISSIASGGVGMNLTIRNIPATGIIPFTIRGTLPDNIPSGGMNLTLLNNQSAFTSIVNPSLPLIIKNAYNTGINNVNLTISNSQTSISSVSQFNLVISGVNPNDINNTLPLIIGAGPTDGFYLNIAGYGDSGNNTLPLVVYNNASPSGMNLSIIGINSTPINNDISFSIPVTDPFATNINLAMSGFGYGINNNLTFSIPSIQLPGLPLVIKGGVGTEKTGVIPFWVAGGYGQGMNMTMLGDRSPVLPASLDLVVLGRGNLSNNDIDFSIINSDSGTAGWGVAYQGMNLTMMRNGTGFGNNVNLSIQGQNLNTSGTVDLTIPGTGWTSVTGVVSLFVNGQPAASSLLPMYIRGF